MDVTEFLEITTHIGCSVNCKKYCPQDEFTKRYKGINNLSLESFKIILSTVPKNVVIIFSGFCEPFLNPECIDLMNYAHEQGYIINLNTTLVGLKLQDIDKLKKINIKESILHLPDCYNNANIPTTEEYKSLLIKFIKMIPNIEYVSMNDKFLSCNRENITRNILSHKKLYPISCTKLIIPQSVVLPNGDVYLCCNDMGLNHKLGNLLTGCYNDIIKSIKHIRLDCIIGKHTLCRYCSFSIFSPIHYIYLILKKNDITIIRRKA